MRLYKEVLYFDDCIVYWMNGGEFHYLDDELQLIKVEKPNDEYTYILKLRKEAKRDNQNEIEKLQREIEHHNLEIERHRVKLAECKVMMKELGGDK